MKNNRRFEYLVSFFFVFILLIPTMGTIFGITSQQDNNEYRKLASPPKLDLAEIENYPKAYQQYFNDNFGFRNVMI